MAAVAYGQITITEVADGINANDKYVWIRYADDANGNGMSNLPNNKKYLGISYNKDTPNESDNPDDYQWSLFLGPQGVPGPRGETGFTTYTWVKYADTATGGGMSDDSNGKNYIGIAYNKMSSTASMKPSDYTWSLFRGEQGVQGPAGKDALPNYTWIKYADDASGTGMSDNPDGKIYIGIAYNKTTATESTNAADYTWSLIRGPQGIQGPKGSDAPPNYTWIRYSDSPDGSNMKSDGTNMGYIGIAYNKISSTPSSNPKDYSWSLIRGAQGDRGVQGPAGKDAAPNYTWIKYADTSTGDGMSDSSANKKYIGIAYNKTTSTASTTPSDYTWSLFRGEQGVQGPAGKDAAPNYTWIKYADDTNGTGMSDNPDGKIYIGIAYNKTTNTESTKAADYTWSLIRGPEGIRGPAGKDAAPNFTWIKYANSADGSGMSDDPAGKKYIGIAYNKTSIVESNVGSDYQWSLIQGERGIQGPPGNDAPPNYTWIKYADTVTGGGMSDNSTNKKYIGIAYNKTTSAASTTPSDYTWSLFRGEQGVQGPAGKDAPPNFTWIKYADDASGTGMSDNPSGKIYIGLAYNKTTSTESTNAADYTWSLIRGPQGIQGPKGSDAAPNYTWIRYSDSPDGSNMKSDGTNMGYIGIAYNKTSSTPSSNPKDYSWSLIRGAQGDRGVQGPAGKDAPPNYTWIKYADDASGTGMSDNPSGKIYIGLAYNKTTSTESTNAADYTWSLIRGPEGIRGPAGKDAAPNYTWVKYASGSDGSGMSDSPTGKKYIGLAYNKTTATESTNASDYAWSLIQGDKGDKGDTGATLYTWVRYADNASGSGISSSPTNKKYIGFAYNKSTPTASNMATDYTWSLIQGNQGQPGPSLYTWVRYADDASGSGISSSPDGKYYIGISYNRTSSTPSNTPGDYVWSLIKGESGVFTEEPLNPRVGTLWIKKSSDPALPDLLLRWDGTGWVQQTLSLAQLDPTQYNRLQDVVRETNNLSSDSILTVLERDMVKDKIMSMIGRIPTAAETLPAITTIDTSGKGEVYTVRKNALNSGIPTSNVDYIAVETAYANLIQYLNSLSPRPWDTSSKSALTINASNWNNLWTAYYNAIFILRTATNIILNGRIRNTEDVIESDINDPEFGLLNRVIDIETKTSESSIIQTVTTSEQYSADLSQKANAEELANYSTIDDLETSLQTQSDTFEEKLAGIDLSPFVTQSQLEQTSEEFNFKFSTTGGINLLKNSTGFSSTDFWEATGTVDTVQNSELDVMGASVGFQLNNGTLKQTILVTSQIYTVSVIVKKGTTGSGYLKVSDESQEFSIPFPEGSDFDFVKFALNIYPIGTQIDIELYGSANSNIIFTSAMCNTGAEPLQWQHAPGEIYNTNVLMDLNGIRIISNAYRGWTSITPDEFSGFAEVDGEMQRVFSLNRDITEMNKADIELELRMGPVKAVPISTTTNKGWAFIPSE